jgi:hypothetical protein
MGRQAAALPDYLAAVQVLPLASLLALAAAAQVLPSPLRLLLAVDRALPSPLQLPLQAVDPGRIAPAERRNRWSRCKSSPRMGSPLCSLARPPPSSELSAERLYRPVVWTDSSPSPAQTVCWLLADRLRASNRNRLAPSNRRLPDSSRLDQSNRRAGARSSARKKSAKRSFHSPIDNWQMPSHAMRESGTAAVTTL